MPETPYATPKTDAEFAQSGRSGFYSSPHRGWFFDGEAAPPIEAAAPGLDDGPQPQPQPQPHPPAPEAAADKKTGAKPGRGDK